MAYQSEAELELQFIDQLNKQGYSTVSVPDYDALVENFKVQFEAFNADKLDKPLTDKEWERILNLMLGKSVFQSAKILRDKFVLEREDGTKVYLSFLTAITPRIFSGNAPDDSCRKVCQSLRCDAPCQRTSLDSGGIKAKGYRHPRSGQSGDALQKAFLQRSVPFHPNLRCFQRCRHEVFCKLGSGDAAQPRILLDRL